MWNDTNKCEYPSCFWDESIPVWTVDNGRVVSAWYSNPEENIHWFEDGNMNKIDSTLWIEISSTTKKPEPPTK